LALAADGLGRVAAGGPAGVGVGAADDGAGLAIRVAVGLGTAVGCGAGARVGWVELPPVTTTIPRMAGWNRQT
jgi:hypothetical protein